MINFLFWDGTRALKNFESSWQGNSLFTSSQLIWRQSASKTPSVIPAQQTDAELADVVA